jgi:hypothetical protein
MQIEWGLNSYNVSGHMDTTRRFHASSRDLNKCFKKFMKGMHKLNMVTFTTEALSYGHAATTWDDDSDIPSIGSRSEGSGAEDY